MRRAYSVILAILLGAAATAIGMGIFLAKSNSDREALVRQINTVRDRARQMEDEKKKLVDEANKKVESANAEVAKAQQVIQAAEEQRKLIASAKQLQRPSARELRGWQTAVSLPLKISVMVPGEMVIQNNNATGISATYPNATSNPKTATVPFLEIRSPDWTTTTNNTVTTSTPVAFLINGHLIAGVIGKTVTGTENATPTTLTAVLRVYGAATTTHVIQLFKPPTLGNNWLEKILGTLEFPS